MVYGFLFLFLLYVVFLLILISGWRKLFAKRELKSQEFFLSVVVACRNEADVITNLLQDLKNQNYKSFEVIIVDDHSEDTTGKLVLDFIQTDSRFSIIPNAGTGKKMAITTGIRSAKGEIIVTTDADCRLGSDWLQTISNNYYDPQVMMVCGGVSIPSHDTFFSKLQAIEFASLIGSGAALIALGKPVMCNGANLSFRKKAFEHVRGYEGNFQVASGDDEFLMRKVDVAFPRGIRFSGDHRSLVFTRPAPSVGRFLRQRFRWAGKWKYNSSRLATILAVMILLSQLMFIATLVMCMGWLVLPGRQLNFISIGLIILGARLVIEYLFLYPVCTFLKVRWHWGAFFILQIVYPFYVVFTGLFSNLTTVTWKGRTLSV